MEEEIINIEPDKSLMKKLGAKNYRIAEAISELVDNSIDAKIQDKILNINIQIDSKKIVITDDAEGMDKQDLECALTIAKSTKKKKLGLFGMGLKQSVMHLGNEFIIRTSKLNNDKAYIFEFNVNKWNENPELNWHKYPIQSEFVHKYDHFTEISITKLGRKLDYPQRIVTKLLADFGERYGPIIKDINIKINRREVIPTAPKIDEETKKEFEFYLNPEDNETKIWGWCGLAVDEQGNVKTSNKGYYGFFTFRHNRMITKWDKLKLDEDNFAIREHLSHSPIIGIINMDCIPVENDKRGFIQNSEEYKKVIQLVRPYCRELEKVLDEKYKPVTTTEEIKIDTEKITYATKKAMLDKEIKELANEEENNLYDKLVSNKVKRKSKETEVGDIEFRISKKENKGSIEPKDGGIRNPKQQKKQGQKHKEVEIDVEGGKKLKIDIIHIYKYDLPDNRIREYIFDKDNKRFIVHTNYGIIPRINNFELPAFALNNIALSLAEFIINSDSFQKIDVLKDKIIVKIGEQLRELTKFTED